MSAHDKTSTAAGSEPSTTEPPAESPVDPMTVQASLAATEAYAEAMLPTALAAYERVLAAADTLVQHLDDVTADANDVRWRMRRKRRSLAMPGDPAIDELLGTAPRLDQERYVEGRYNDAFEAAVASATELGATIRTELDRLRGPIMGPDGESELPNDAAPAQRSRAAAIDALGGVLLDCAEDGPQRIRQMVETKRATRDATEQDVIAELAIHHNAWARRNSLKIAARDAWTAELLQQDNPTATYRAYRRAHRGERTWTVLRGTIIAGAIAMAGLERLQWLGYGALTIGLWGLWQELTTGRPAEWQEGEPLATVRWLAWGAAASALGLARFARGWVVRATHHCRSRRDEAHERVKIARIILAGGDPTEENGPQEQQLIPGRNNGHEAEDDNDGDPEGT